MAEHAMTPQESAALMAWAKAHSGVYALAKLAPKDDAIRAMATEAWDAIERLFDAVKALPPSAGTGRTE